MATKKYKKDIFENSLRDSLIYYINLLNNPYFKEFNEDINNFRNYWLSKKTTNIDWDTNNQINNIENLKLTKPIFPISIDREDFEYIFHNKNILGIDDDLNISNWQSEIKEKFGINIMIKDIKNGSKENRAKYEKIIFYELLQKKTNNYDKFNLLFKLKNNSFIMEMYLNKIIKDGINNDLFKFYKNLKFETREKNTKKIKTILETIFGVLKKEKLDSNMISNIYENVRSYDEIEECYKKAKKLINNIILELRKEKINIREISKLFQKLLENNYSNDATLFLKTKRYLEIIFENFISKEFDFDVIKNIHENLNSNEKNTIDKEDKIKKIINNILSEIKEGKIDYTKIGKLYNKVVDNKISYTENKFSALVFYELEKDFIDSDNISNIYINLAKNLKGKKYDNILSEFISEINKIKIDYYNLFDFYFDLGNYLNKNENRFNQTISSEIEFKVYFDIFNIYLDFSDEHQKLVIDKLFNFIDNYYNKYKSKKITNALSEDEIIEYKLFKRSYAYNIYDINKMKTKIIREEDNNIEENDKTLIYREMLDYKGGKDYPSKYKTPIVKGYKTKNIFTGEIMKFDFKVFKGEIKKRFVNLINKWSYRSLVGSEFEIDEINNIFYDLSKKNKDQENHKKSSFTRDKIIDIDPLDDSFAIFLSNCITFKMSKIKNLNRFFIPVIKRLYDLKELIVQFRTNKYELKKLKEMIDDPKQTREDISKLIHSDKYKEGKEKYKNKLLSTQEPVWSYPGKLPLENTWVALRSLKKEELESSEVKEELKGKQLKKLEEFYKWYVEINNYDISDEKEFEKAKKYIKSKYNIEHINTILSRFDTYCDLFNVENPFN